MLHDFRETREHERVVERLKIEPADILVRQHKGVRSTEFVLPKNSARAFQRIRPDQHGIAVGTEIDVD